MSLVLIFLFTFYNQCNLCNMFTNRWKVSGYKVNCYALSPCVMQCNYVTPWEKQETGHESHLFLSLVSGFLIIISMFTELNFPYPEMLQDQNLKHDFCSYWTWPEKSISCFHTSSQLEYSKMSCPHIPRDPCQKCDLQDKMWSKKGFKDD